MWKDGRRTMICKQLDTFCIVHVSTQHCVGGYEDEDSVYLWNKKTPLRRPAPNVLQLNSSSFPLSVFSKETKNVVRARSATSRRIVHTILQKQLHYALCIMHYACCAVSAVLSSSPARSFVCLRLKNPIREQIRHPFRFWPEFWVCEVAWLGGGGGVGDLLGGVLRMEGVDVKRWLG